VSDQTPTPQNPQAQPSAPARKSWFARHKITSALGAIVLVIIVANAMSSNGGNSNTGGSSNTAAGDTTSSNVGGLTDTADSTGSQPAKPAHTHTAPAMTVSQENALRTAKDYLSMEGFSRRGLIQQLSSKMGEGFPKADAVFAVNHLNVSWNKQAVRSGKDYLSMEGFSRSGLIDQLSSKMGEGFTHAQAVYAANHLGL
jgi:hypothetical protein